MRYTSSDQNTFWLIFELASIVKPQIQALADRYSLTAQQCHVLGYLHKNKEPQTMSSLAAILICDASNITGIIDRMVAMGVVDRTESPKDRRVKIVQLTDKGAEIYDTIMGVISDATEQRIDQILSAKEKEYFRSILVKLVNTGNL